MYKIILSYLFYSVKRSLKKTIICDRIQMKYINKQMKEENICRKHKCSDCCVPVKVKRGFKNYWGKKFEELPFKERKEIWIPKSHPDTVKLEVYDCDLFDEKTGLCKDIMKIGQAFAAIRSAERLKQTMRMNRERLLNKIKKKNFIYAKNKGWRVFWWNFTRT